MTETDTPAPGTGARRFALAALERHKHEGMKLAVRARLAALAVFGVLLPFLIPLREVLYFEAMFVIFALIGWAQLRVARVGRSLAEVLLIYADVALMTVVLLVPNPLAEGGLPVAMQYRNSGFPFYLVLLAVGTLAYTWRTIRGMGGMIAVFWIICAAAIWYFADENVAMTEATETAFAEWPRLAIWLNPNNILPQFRVQEAALVMVVAFILSITVRRNGDLLLGHAELERERANLARYFSPNVVEELSHNDEPLKQVREQNVAVLFVDIVGFTTYAAGRPSTEVIDVLRDFHRLMEAEVFAHRGTLDKYLGDGLMATFGTPFRTGTEAQDALACARAMAAALARWNAGRAGQPIRAGFGLHFGPAVLGDIGAHRLEFAVIGNTVNVASRVETLTRAIDAEIAATDALIEAARAEGDVDLEGMTRHEALTIRGVAEPMTIWATPRKGDA